MPDTLASILAEARADVAAGRHPDLEALEARIRAAGDDEAAVERTLEQLRRVLAVHRARSRVEERPLPPPTPAPQRRAGYRTKPTVGANFDVRREGDADAAALVWDAAPAVVEWEVRISERPDARSEYVVGETRTLPGPATRLELQLGDLPLRIHLLGRSGQGRLVRRALVSGLTRDNWRDRWQRRASAS